MSEVLNFFCPYCGKKTTIKREFNPMGKKKKCKSCEQVFVLNSDTMCIRIISSLKNNPLNSTQIKPAAKKVARQAQVVTTKTIQSNSNPSALAVKHNFNETKITAPAKTSSPKIATTKITKSLSSNDSPPEKLDNTSRGKKILIDCPYCNCEYRIRVYRNFNRYKCTKTDNVFSLDNVKTMKIVDLSGDSGGRDILPIFDETNTTEEKTIEINLQNTTRSETMSINKVDDYLKGDERNSETISERNIDISKLPPNNSETTVAKLLLEKKIIADKYQIIGEIGTGGFGYVYMAFDKVLHRYVAIKLGVSIERKEAEKLARLNHPNIVQVYDFGFYEKSPYIVMEYIQGMNICEYMQKLRTLHSEEDSTLQICRLFCELCDVVSYLHKNNVYHADIKPHNILVANNHSVKLIDFGALGSFTYKYAAPERFEGKSPDIKSDIYSLGGVFFEILTGKAPNEGNRVIEVIYNSALEKSFPNDKEIDPKLKEICLQCMDGDPEKRYKNVHEIRLELMEYISKKHKVNSIPHIYLDSIKVMLPLSKIRNYIGRALTNDIILDDENISRIHAVIHIEKNVVSIENISKHYPVTISGERLLPGQKKDLCKEEKIAIGQFKFTFVPKQTQEKVLETNDKSFTVQALKEEPLVLKDDDFTSYFKKTNFDGWEINGE